MRKVVIVGSGLSAMAFVYQLVREKAEGVKLYIICDLETGIVNDGLKAHGHLAATRYRGLGGNANIWGKVCSPFEFDFDNLHEEVIGVTCDFLGLNNALHTWKKDCSTVGSIERHKFFYSRDLTSFWSEMLPLLEELYSVTLLHNTSAEKINKTDGKYEIRLTGAFSRSSINNVDTIILAAGYFGTRSILQNSVMISDNSAVDVDHCMVTIGSIELNQRHKTKRLLNSNQIYKEGLLLKLVNRSITIYMQPSLSFKVCDTSAQDRAEALSLIIRPWKFIFSKRVIFLINPKVWINVMELISSYIIGTRLFDILAIVDLDPTQTSKMDIESVLKPNELLQIKQLVLDTLPPETKFKAKHQSALLKEQSSAIHRTCNISDSTTELKNIHIVDANSILKRSSINPTFTICMNAIETAQRVVEQWRNENCKSA